MWILKTQSETKLSERKDDYTIKIQIIQNENFRMNYKTNLLA